jgi:hypothetical protein
MSTLIEDVTALLKTLPGVAGGVWYALNENQSPIYPYITWQRIVSPTNMNLSGPSDLQNTRIQIDIFARKALEADAISKALDAALDTWAVTNVPLSTQDFPEPEVRAFRISRDVSVWAKN